MKEIEQMRKDFPKKYKSNYGITDEMIEQYKAEKKIRLKKKKKKKKEGLVYIVVIIMIMIMIMIIVQATEKLLMDYMYVGKKIANYVLIAETTIF